MTDRWQPHPSAVERAKSIVKVIDLDIHIERYILRCRERSREPSSAEWLRWVLDDEQEARLKERRARDPGGTDEIGVPRTWY